MDNGSITAVIFDLGNVMLDFDHRIAGRRIAQYSNKTADEIYNLFFDSKLTAAFEEGRITPQEFFEEVKKALNLKIGFETFLPIWNEIFFFSEKNLFVYNLARKLKENYKVALLSNINELHLEYIEKTFPILDAFHHIFASCSLKLRKPDPEIYRSVLKSLGVSAGNAFYTDDRAELVLSAKAIGIQGFVFSGADKLKNDMLTSGINVN